MILDTPGIDNGLSLFSKEIEKALFDAEILRNHLTIEIRTPESWKQEYSVVYRNKRKKEGSKEDDALNCIRLPPRRKKVQRNLSVNDRKRHQLTIVPSELVNKALVNICEFHLYEALQSTKYAHKEPSDELIRDHINFCDVFSYDSEPALIQDILDKLRRVIVSH